MPDSLIILEYYLASITKCGGTLKLKDLVEFFKLWHEVDKHANKIFHYLEINWFSQDSDTLFQPPSKANCKTVLQLLWLSKKPHNIDILLIIEDAWMTDL